MRTMLAAMLAAAFFALPVSGLASEAAPQTKNIDELAKETQNPMANLISLPFQYNINAAYGPDGGVQSLLRIQPVIPFELGKKAILITRTILPIAYNPWPKSVFGLSDMQINFFFGPLSNSKLMWGLGPVVLFPTATSSSLGSGKWCAGPTGVLAWMPGKWVLGLMVNNMWSFAGWGETPFNQLFLQYFINYNIADGWYIAMTPVITANWQAPNTDRWLVPLGVGFGKTFFAGKLPMNAGIQGYWNVVHPSWGEQATVRFALQFLFPK